MLVCVSHSRVSRGAIFRFPSRACEGHRFAFAAFRAAGSKSAVGALTETVGSAPDQRLRRGGKITAEGPIWIFAARRRTSFTMQAAHSNTWFWFLASLSSLGPPPQTSLQGVENGFPVTSPPRSFKGLLKLQFIFSPDKSHRGTPQPQLPLSLPRFNRRGAIQAAGERDRRVDVMKQWRLCFWEWVEER